MAPSHVRVVVRLHVKQLTGESAGQPLSSEINPSGTPTLLIGAEGNIGHGAIRESCSSPAESKTLCMRGNAMLENREISVPCGSTDLWGGVPGDRHSYRGT